MAQRVLLDTHAFLWFVFDDRRLSRRAAQVIGKAGSAAILSHVSLWEIAVKVTVGKLRLGMPYEAFVQQVVESRDIELLSIDVVYFKTYATLPLYHRDPFDRLLVAQCQTDNLAIVSIDDSFDPYGIRRIW